MRIDTVTIILSATLMLSCSTICHADSVVISFEGGKTQTIQLDAPIKSINAVQYLPSSEQSSIKPAPTRSPAHPVTSPATHEEKQPQQQQSPVKPLVNFKWAEPIIGQ